MSTIVCVPCETNTTTTTLKLRLAAPPATPPPSAIDLSFLQSVSSTSYAPFSTKLSARSLELCTENLGSETGCEMMMMSDDMTFFSSNKKRSCSKPMRKLSDRRRTKSFPPPLTTINTLQVRRQSEEGRVIVEAVEKTEPVLQAERSNGRLRLSFLRKNETEEEEDEVSENESDSESENEQEDVGMEEEVKKVEFERVWRCSSNQQGSWRKHAAANFWVAASS